MRVKLTFIRRHKAGYQTVANAVFHNYKQALTALCMWNAGIGMPDDVKDEWEYLPTGIDICDDSEELHAQAHTLPY